MMQRSTIRYGFSLTDAASMTTSVWLGVLSLSMAALTAPPVPGGPTPHNNPARVLPTEPFVPMSNPIPDFNPDYWFSRCVEIGQCADLGAPCPNTAPSGGATASAIWCSWTYPRSECQLATDPIGHCAETNSGCGAEVTGTWVYQPNGTFTQIAPLTIRYTGFWCPGTSCVGGH